MGRGDNILRTVGITFYSNRMTPVPIGYVDLGRPANTSHSINTMRLHALAGYSVANVKCNRMEVENMEVMWEFWATYCYIYGVRGGVVQSGTSRKVAGSIPNGVIWPHHGPGVDSASNRNTRGISWGRGAG
jgi:hypothetical protein